MINSGNYKFILYGLLRHFNEKAYFSQCYTFKLNKDMFSVKNKDMLLVYDGDIKNSKNNQAIIASRVNQNLNNLQNKLDKYRVKLIFMPAPDKYTVYYNYLASKKYPRSLFFDEIAKLDKKYIFVNTKQILQNELNKNQKDTYFADDTHWSFKASETIVKTMDFIER